LSRTAREPFSHKLHPAVILVVWANDFEMIARDDGMHRLVERGKAALPGAVPKGACDPLFEIV
jgi:hypothetical protein